MTTFSTVALFGANGQIGTCILQALLGCKKQSFEVTCFIPPDSPAPPSATDLSNVHIREIDLTKTSKEELGKVLKGIDVVVSALNGPALEAQYKIQDAAADVGVKRYYPSEYGMHHIYRKPDDPQGYMHPVRKAIPPAI